jgi:hypothetical protein
MDTKGHKGDILISGLTGGWCRRESSAPTKHGRFGYEGYTRPSGDACVGAPGRNVQSAGWDSAIFALFVLFHWTVALALAAVLERRSLGHPLRAADLMRIPVALLGAVMRSGLVSICVFGAGLLLLAPALWRPGLSEFLAAPALLFAYALAWIPFVASHWRRHE